MCGEDGFYLSFIILCSTYIFNMCLCCFLLNEHLKVNLYYASVKNVQYHIPYFPKLM